MIKYKIVSRGLDVANLAWTLVVWNSDIFNSPSVFFIFFNFVFADVEMQENEESQSVH